MIRDKPTGKRLLGMRKWEDNIRIDLKELDVSTKAQIDSAQDMDFQRSLVNAALILSIP